MRLGRLGPFVRSLRLIVILICITSSFILPQFAWSISNAASQGQSTQGPPSNNKPRRAKPVVIERGKPPVSIGDPDEVRRRARIEPAAPQPVASSMRSRLKQLKTTMAPPSTSGGRSAWAPSRDGGARAHHASSSVKGRRNLAPSPVPLGDDIFVANFILNGAARTATNGEIAYWTDILRSGSGQGSNSQWLAARELGRTVFESGDYANRGRTNHDYIYDLYKAYLGREPGQTEWDNWTTYCGANGREATREAIADSYEFHYVLAGVAPSGAISANASSIVTARVDPLNQTGDQIAARDGEWSVPLLSLPGRAGLDLGLSLSYSSLVWTRSGPADHPYLYFDEDQSATSPGFRIGFASMQGPYFDAQVQRKVYLLVSSSGHRTELRQVGTTNIYEAADSSYLQLTDNGSTLLLRTTDGTQLLYAAYAGVWQPTNVKDRNGNYLTITNDDNTGDIKKITDTLGREVYFTYDGYGNLSSINQGWNGTTHFWATFSWGAPLSMDTSSFSGVSVVGTHTGESIPVLRQVGLADGSYYYFDYNAVGQVTVVHRYTSDNVHRAYLSFDYDGSSTDCPRLIQTRQGAYNWTDTTTHFTVNSDGSHQMSTPDGTIYREYYGNGWQKGLATHSEVWGKNDPSNTNNPVLLQKWIDTQWTQDDETSNYQNNPRVKENNICDNSNNCRGTHTDYGSFGLPAAVIEYATNVNNPIRRTVFDYLNDSGYTERRIIGLLSRQTVYEGATIPVARTTYDYDDGNSIQSQATWATMHDANYGVTNLKRGNVTSVSRWDVTDVDNGSKLTTRMTYDAAGNLLTTTDPRSHQSSIAYADSFSNTGDHNTFAYPTTVTDADGYNSLLKYNYDYGLKTSVQTPQPNTINNVSGPIQTFAYDAALRLTMVTTLTNGAYRTFDYGPDYMQSNATVNNVANESYSVQFFDGMGRTIVTASYLPDSGHYAMQVTQYDAMGQVSRQSNPTETAAGAPAGDDASWHYTQQTYDWKGRPLATTNQDGSYKEASYQGCGCAGGQVVTVTDEMNRQQKIYSDVLGRPVKTEVLNWNGSVYSTTMNTLNARDQVTNVRVTDNATGNYQDTTMTFDGYGRLQTKHVPEQNTGTATGYAYNDDDTLSSMTDARGATANYVYNNGRHLVNEIHYSSPTGVANTSNVTFSYDSAGNRISLIDGFGSKSYSYDQLSRLSSETRTISGVGTFALSYDYNLAGELKKVTDASNSTINYSFDSTGRLNGITGSDNVVGGIANYASSFQYRAWGALKTMTDGGSHTSSSLYNSRLQPRHFDLSGDVVAQSYDYYADGRLSFVHNLNNANFDRSYSYDHLGRLSENKTGGDARGDGGDMPYHETFSYDAWSNLTGRSTDTWNWNDSFIDSASYVNNRRSDWGYDADGRNTSIDTRSYTFDAAGQTTSMTGKQWLVHQYFNVTQTAGYDGDGAKIQDTTRGVTTYYLRSSVLGGAIIEELSSAGAKNAGYVYMPDGQMIAKQIGNQVTWKYTTPADTSQYEFSGNDVTRTEFDPLGANVQLTGPPLGDTNGGAGDIGGSHFDGPMDQRYADLTNPAAGCTIDNMVASCSAAMGVMNSGAGVSGPASTTRWNWSLNGGQGGFQFFRAFATGQGWGDSPGWIPDGSPARPSVAPTLKPFNDLRHPYRPFDPNIEQPIHLAPNPDDSSYAGSSGGYTEDQVKLAVSLCTPMFGVDYVDMQFSSRGHNGSFTGKNQYGSEENSHIHVVNDVNSFSKAQLGRIYGRSGYSSEPINGLTIPYVANGRVTGFSPYRNYTGNDRGPDQWMPGVSRWVDTQIWELGNSLDDIRHELSPSNKTKNEPGFLFQKCVKEKLRGAKQS